MLWSVPSLGDAVSSPDTSQLEAKAENAIRSLRSPIISAGLDNVSPAKAKQCVS